MKVSQMLGAENLKAAQRREGWLAAASFQLSAGFARYADTGLTVPSKIKSKGCDRSQPTKAPPGRRTPGS